MLIAVAGTSRRRYPRPMKDRDAFIRFLLDEHPVVVGGVSDWVPRCEDDYLRCIEAEKAFVLKHEPRLLVVGRKGICFVPIKELPF